MLTLQLSEREIQKLVEEIEKLKKNGSTGKLHMCTCVRVRVFKLEHGACYVCVYMHIQLCVGARMFVSVLNKNCLVTYTIYYDYYHKQW